MKMLLCVILTVILQVSAVRQQLVRDAKMHASAHAVIDQASEGNSGLRSAISSMVAKMLERRDMKVKGIIQGVQDKMDIQEASDSLQSFKDLPPDVAALVRLTGKTDKANKTEQAPFDEASIQKARRILNGMIETAWLELDDVIFESKEFEERNRGTYEQVVNDLSRLGAQLAGLEEKRMAGVAAIAAYGEQRTQIDGIFEGVRQTYTAMLNTNQLELTRRKNDLAVFDFILNMTRCKEGQTFLQIGAVGAAKGASALQRKLQVCTNGDGDIALHFDDKAAQRRVERLMTPDARMALRAALGQFGHKMSLLQVDDFRNSTSPQVAVVVPVTEDPHPAGQWKKCVDGEENCGLLHDLMSLEWGKFRDEVDELTATMREDKQNFDAQETNYNQQCTVITDAKSAAEEMLADAVSNINADTEEMGEKDEQKMQLTQEFDKTMAVFRATISEILHTKICAVRKVRNGICMHSSDSPPSKISDCDVSDWASKTGECFSPGGIVITCDDACPHPTDPYQCGGEETMKRDVVVLKNQYGISCPPLERQKRCGQKKCEVNCDMSTWSGWSACSKDCEGGVMVRTRSIITKPKHGGRQCDSPQDERPCNTGSCDRNCQLDGWTRWDFCSMSCGGGSTTRTRSVLVPIRGQGTCPDVDHVDRLETAECNTQACVGDEICVAKQDLVIALDASGSLKEGGFDILKNFTYNLTKKYQPLYFGEAAVKMGLVLFGNGHLVFNDDGTSTTSSAIPVQPLTLKLDTVREKVKEQTWQRGYTNMAQAFASADTLLSQGGRENAQSAVLVVTDGRYSMAYQTFEKARELKDKNVMVLLAAVTDWTGPDLEPLKRLVTHPWETNFEKIPGLAALKANIDLYTSKLIAKFCPDSMSPSLMEARDIDHQYMMIHEGAIPGAACYQGVEQFLGYLNTADECAEAAREVRDLYFYFSQHRGGLCISIPLTVDQNYWDTYVDNRVDPPCPAVDGKLITGDVYEAWTIQPFGDSFVINPRSLNVGGDLE